MWMIALVTFWLPLQPAFQDPWLIIPGKQVGPITMATTTKDLIRIYGENNVRSSQSCSVLDGLHKPCILLFENTDRKVRIILGATRRVEIYGDHRWHKAEGIHIGSKAQDLVRLNGSKFEYPSFTACCCEGYVSSWIGGKLENTLPQGDIFLYLSHYQQPLSTGNHTGVSLSSDLPKQSRVNFIQVILTYPTLRSTLQEHFSEDDEMDEDAFARIRSDSAAGEMKVLCEEISQIQKRNDDETRWLVRNWAFALDFRSFHQFKQWLTELNHAICVKELR